MNTRRRPSRVLTLDELLAEIFETKNTSKRKRC
jgi:hypothetical protein